MKEKFIFQELKSTSSGKTPGKNISDLEKKCFPKSWLYEDAVGYYNDKLKNGKGNISIAIMANKRLIGFLLAVPQDSILGELKVHDKKLKAKNHSLYIETVEIDPKYQGRGLFSKAIYKLITLSKKRGILRVSLHARTKNNMADKIKNIFYNKKIRPEEDRNIKKWYYGDGEKYKYLSFKLNKK